MLAQAVAIPFCGCWIWMRSTTAAGYPDASRSGAVVYVHRLMLSLKLGRELEEGERALHTCDTPPCIAPDHLFAGTQRDNMIDKVSKGRANCAVGEAAGVSKLRAEQVREIRTLYACGGISQRALGRRFGVTHKTIGPIINGTAWRHL